jgi:hypothetical protein
MVRPANEKGRERVECLRVFASAHLCVGRVVSASGLGVDGAGARTGCGVIDGLGNVGGGASSTTPGTSRLPGDADRGARGVFIGFGRIGLVFGVFGTEMDDAQFWGFEGRGGIGFFARSIALGFEGMEALFDAVTVGLNPGDFLAKLRHLPLRCRFRRRAAGARQKTH